MAQERWEDKVLNRAQGEKYFIPVVSVIVGIAARFDSSIRKDWIQGMIDGALKTGYVHPWMRGSLRLLSGKDRRSADVQIEQALADYDKKGK